MLTFLHFSCVCMVKLNITEEKTFPIQTYPSHSNLETQEENKLAFNSIHSVCNT